MKYTLKSALELLMSATPEQLYMAGIERIERQKGAMKIDVWMQDGSLRGYGSARSIVVLAAKIIGLSEYQREVLSRLLVRFPGRQICVGRGDRLLVDGEVVRGVLLYDARELEDYDGDAAWIAGLIG